MKKNWPLFLIFIFGSQGRAASSISPSFECQKAQSINEKLICSSEKLSSLDQKSTVVYRQIFSAAKNDAEKEKLKGEQKLWLKERDKKCQDKTSVACLQNFYETRISSQKQMAEVLQTTGSPSVPSHEPAGAASKAKVWSLLAPAKESDYFDPIITNDPSLPTDGIKKVILSGIEKESRQMLLAIFNEDKSGLKVVAQTTEDLMGDDIDPSESILSGVDLESRFAKLNPAAPIYAFRGTYEFNSTSTHCGAEKLFIFVLQGKELKRSFEALLNSACDDEKPAKTNVEISAHATKGFKDLVLIKGKKKTTFTWDGESYSAGK